MAKPGAVPEHSLDAQRWIDAALTVLKAQRYVLNLSQEAAARAINRDRQTLIRWESGKTSPNWGRLFDWAAGLGLSMPKFTALVEKQLREEGGDIR